MGGAAQGEDMTPPTQLAMSGSAVLRVGLGAAVGRAVTDRYAMPDGDLVGADEDVFDEQPQDALTFGNGGGGGLGAQVGEEVLEAVGELKVDLAVGQLGVEGLNLLAQAGLAGAQPGHAGAQLIQGDQLLLVGADQPVDRLAGLDQRGVQALALGDGGVGGACLVEALVDLGADQGRVGQQRGDLLPDDGVEVVGAHRLVGADAAVFVAVVIRAQAAVVVDLLVRGAGGGAVVGVAAAGAGADPL